MSFRCTLWNGWITRIWVLSRLLPLALVSLELFTQVTETKSCSAVKYFHVYIIMAVCSLEPERHLRKQKARHVNKDTANAYLSEEAMDQSNIYVQIEDELGEN